MKKYRIGIYGFSDSDCAETEKMLTKEEFDLVSGIFKDLQFNSYGDYTPSITIEEAKVTVWKIQETDEGILATCDNAECVHVGQKLTDRWNDEEIVYTVKSIGKKRLSERMVVLGQNYY